MFPQLNVLIDDGEKAVLCDFGLSHVKVDVSRRTKKQDAEVVVGSYNWMAPELLMGGDLEEPCDIYAYGMTIYEVSFGLPTLSIPTLKLY
jgi:serine/threonine protein kinase